LIYPDDAKEFSRLMIVLWQSNGRNAPTRELMADWFDKLKQHDIDYVKKVFDTVIKNSYELPTFKVINDALRPKEEFYKALPRPVANEISKQQSEKIVELVNATKPKRDMKSWIYPILENPKNYPTIAVKSAQEVKNAL